MRAAAAGGGRRRGGARAGGRGESRAPSGGKGWDTSSSPPPPVLAMWRRSHACETGIPCSRAPYVCSCATSVASVPAAFSSCTAAESIESIPAPAPPALARASPAAAAARYRLRASGASTMGSDSVPALTIEAMSWKKPPPEAAGLAGAAACIRLPHEVCAAVLACRAPALRAVHPRIRAWRSVAARCSLNSMRLACRSLNEMVEPGAAPSGTTRMTFSPEGTVIFSFEPALALAGTSTSYSVKSGSGSAGDSLSPLARSSSPTPASVAPSSAATDSLPWLLPTSTTLLFFKNPI